MCQRIHFVSTWYRRYIFRVRYAIGIGCRVIDHYIIGVGNSLIMIDHHLTIHIYVYITRKERLLGTYIHVFFVYSEWMVNYTFLKSEHRPIKIHESNLRVVYPRRPYFHLSRVFSHVFSTYLCLLGYCSTVCLRQKLGITFASFRIYKVLTQFIVAIVLLTVIISHTEGD